MNRIDHTEYANRYFALFRFGCRHCFFFFFVNIFVVFFSQRRKEQAISQQNTNHGCLRIECNSIVVTRSSRWSVVKWNIRGSSSNIGIPTVCTITGWLDLVNAGAMNRRCLFGNWHLITNNDDNDDDGYFCLTSVWKVFAIRVNERLNISRDRIIIIWIRDGNFMADTLPPKGNINSILQGLLLLLHSSSPLDGTLCPINEFGNSATPQSQLI